MRPSLFFAASFYFFLFNTAVQPNSNSKAPNPAPALHPRRSAGVRPSVIALRLVLMGRMIR